MKTPDYQVLTKTLKELDNLRKSLQKEVKRQTKAAEDRREQRVADYSRKIAARMQLSEPKQQEIYWMGLLHDIGKIGIPDTIINKTGRLTDEEFHIIQSHPVIDVDILNTISEIPNISEGARSHHEKYDGSGYPDRLSEENIPFKVRISVSQTPMTA